MTNTLENIVGIKEEFYDGVIVVFRNGKNGIVWKENKREMEEADNISLIEREDYSILTFTKNGLKAYMFTLPGTSFRSSIRSDYRYISCEIVVKAASKIVFLLNEENNKKDAYVVLQNETQIHYDVKRVKTVRKLKNTLVSVTKVTIIYTKDQIYLYNDIARIFVDEVIKKVKLNGRSSNCLGIYLNNNLYYDIYYSSEISCESFRIVCAMYYHMVELYIAIEDKDSLKQSLLNMYQYSKNKININDDEYYYTIVYDNLDKVEKIGSFIVAKKDEEIIVLNGTSPVFGLKNVNDVYKLMENRKKLEIVTGYTIVVVESINKSVEYLDIFSIKRMTKNNVVISNKLKIGSHIYSNQLIGYYEKEDGIIFVCKEKTLMLHGGRIFLLNNDFSYENTIGMDIHDIFNAYASAEVTKKNKKKGEYFEFLCLNELVFSGMKNGHCNFGGYIYVDFFEKKIEIKNRLTNETIKINVDYKELKYKNVNELMEKIVLSNQFVSPLTKELIKSKL